MDRYYSPWTEDIITQMWLTNQVCPPDSDDAKEFIANVSNGSFRMTDIPKDLVDDFLKHYIGMVMESCNFPYIPHPCGTQSFPDYEVGNDWIEVKSFDANNYPSFDIVSLDKLIHDLELGENGALYTDYIVLGYQYNDGTFYIESAGMYKIWELAAASESEGKKYIKTTMDGIVRPRSSLRANDKSTPPAFEDEYDFLTALYNIVLETNNNEYEAERWLARVTENSLIAE